MQTTDFAKDDAHDKTRHKSACCYNYSRRRRQVDRKVESDKLSLRVDVVDWNSRTLACLNDSTASRGNYL